MSRLTRLLVVAVFCGALVVPAISSAASNKPGVRFGRTFPVATRLCNHAANGHLPKALQGSATQVAAACATLKSTFTTTQNAYDSTVGPLKTQALADLKALRQTCRQARQNHQQGVCKAARQSTRAMIQGLKAQVQAAGQTYRTAIQTARTTFWATIHALKGGASIQADGPSTVPAPAPTMPSTSQIDAS